MKKRFLSLLLTAAMCFALLPGAALAEDEVLPVVEQTAEVPSAPGEQGDTEQQTEDAAQPAEDENGEGGENGGNGENGEEAGAAEPEENADEAADADVLAVQERIDALPGADELPDMDADELEGAYMAILAAYEAYDALTAEQQEQITGADCFEELFGWFNEQTAPLADASADYRDDVDANGDIIKNANFSRSGPLLENTATDVTLSGQFYIVQSDMTIDGDLTVDGSRDGGLVLCAGATLTVTGALIHMGGTSFFIYGQSNKGADAGRLIIQNSNGDGAAIRSTANNSQLGINSGELELHGGTTGQLVDKVALYSSQPVHKATTPDGETMPLADWRYKTSISGEELVIEYCEHNNAEYESTDSTHHIKSCTQCGFVGTAVDCGNDGYERYVSDGDTGHRKECPCGKLFGDVIAHTMITVPKDSTYHITGCQECDYTSGSRAEHTWDSNTGECTVCHFAPVAEDGYNNAFESVTEALETVAKEGGINNYVLLAVSGYTGGSKTVINENIVFNQPGKTVELRMNGHTLENDGNPVITVEAGTLKITGAATINQTAQSHEMVAPAIKVTGGELIFEDTLNVTGSAKDSSAAPAILVTDGTVTFEKDVIATAVENAGTDTAIAPAVKVTGGKLIFNGKLTATGGLGGVAGNRRNCEPAVYAEGGELEFNGDLDLNGGLKITGSAKLTKGLTQGTFKVDYDGQTVTGDRVSVVGSTNYADINSMLAANHVFYAEGNNRYLVFGEKSWASDVTIVDHEHTWAKSASGDTYECTVCGVACAHEGGYKSGKCEVCGKPCPHDMADQSPTDHYYYCNECGQKMAARIQTDTYKWAHYTDLAAAVEAVEDGQTITLLDGIDNSGKYILITGDNKTVTLDLHGNTINGGWMQVGIDRDGDNYSSTTLNITGNGSFSGYLSIGYSATLDLSGWTGGEITTVVPHKSGDDESTLIVGENAGTIKDLQIFSWPTDSTTEITRIKNTELSGGSYGAISITMTSDKGANRSIPYSSMLAGGYAFQYIDTEDFVEYTAKAEYSHHFDNIEKVKVVKCPHGKVENGTCAYCGKTDIAATLGTTVYTESDLEQAFTDWQNTNGVTLTLHQDCSLSSSIVWYDVSNGTLDLNGHTLTVANKSSVQVSTGSSVTIVDNSANGGGKIDGRLYIDRGSLTLESGEITSLDVENASDGNVKLRGGKVTSYASDGSILVYRLLEDGYYLEGSALLAKFSGGPYEVKNANITVDSEKKGEVAIGKNIVNIPVSLTLADTSTTAVTFDWYLVGTNGNDLSKLASVEAAVTNGVAAYDPTKAEKSTEAGWDSLEKYTDYTLVCMTTGMAGANISWQAALTGYRLYTLPPSLEDAEITFAEGWQERIFWPDANDNSVGKTEISSALGAYTVKLGNIALTEGTDYTVSGNVATGIGTQDLIIEGVAPKYSGTKTVQWEVVPHTLKMLEIKQSEKQYDGTTDLPAGAFSEYFNSNDGYGQITLEEGTDYVVTDARFDTPDASDQNKVYRYTVELKNPNYVFEDGTKVRTVVYGEEAHTTLSITKADALAAEDGTLEVVNNRADTYTVDLPALPALTSPMEYGKVSYTLAGVDLDDYYKPAMGEAKIENGKLILPIQAVATEKEGAIGTVTVNVSSTNIETFGLTINVNATNKIVPTGAPALSKTTLTWGDPLTDIKLSGSMQDEKNGKEVTGTFTWDDTNQMTIGKNQMTWIFTPDDTATYADVKGTSEIEVVKATPTGAPEYSRITSSGSTLKDAKLAIGTITPAEGTIAWDLDESTAVSANVYYAWTFTPTDSEHYNDLTGSIQLYHKSSSSGGGATTPTTPTTPTTSDEDNSTTKTETKPDGTVTETVTKPDGTETITETKPDGTVTETETKPDGTVTETETKPDGTVTETVSKPDGSQTTTETNPDGSSTTETTTADGSSGLVTVDVNGKTEAKAAISDSAIEDAKNNGTTIELPVEVKSEKDSDSAPTVNIDLGAPTGTDVSVEIPVSNVTPGTVAILVHEDGTEEILKSSRTTDNGVQIRMDGSATVKIVDNSKDFSDTRDHWSKDSVDFVTSRGLFSGVGKDQFGVGSPMTRGMVNTVLARLAGVDTTPAPGQQWYEVGMQWAKDNGISDGTNPLGNVTREQFAALLYRYDGAPEVRGSLTFRDVNDISSYAEDAMLWAVQNGIISGVGDERVAPKANANREQVAAMMERYLKNL